MNDRLCPFQIPVVNKGNGGVSGLFDKDSTEFKDLLQQLLVTFAIVMILGMTWNYLIRLYFLRRNRVFPNKTANEILKGILIKILPFS